VERVANSIEMGDMRNEYISNSYDVTDLIISKFEDVKK